MTWFDVKTTFYNTVIILRKSLCKFYFCIHFYTPKEACNIFYPNNSIEIAKCLTLIWELQESFVKFGIKFQLMISLTYIHSIHFVISTQLISQIFIFIFNSLLSICRRCVYQVRIKHRLYRYFIIQRKFFLLLLLFLPLYCLLHHHLQRQETVHDLCV